MTSSKIIKDKHTPSSSQKIDSLEPSKEDKKREKHDEWINTRRLGFCSFLIPVTIISILSTKTFGGKTNNVVMTSWGWEPVQKTVLYFSLWTIKEVRLDLTTLTICVTREITPGPARDGNNLSDIA